MLTWETTSFFFSALLSQEPLKKGMPLSTGSKDPNGTLITGLRAKRDVVKTFAFWELVLVAQKHPDRRKEIFSDIGRDGGTAWSQMLTAALDVVQGINTRIEEATTKSKTAEAAHDPDAMEIDSLPRIAPPIKEKSIYANSPPPQNRTEEIESYIDWGAKRIGQSKTPYNPPISKVKELLKHVLPSGIKPETLTFSAFVRYIIFLLHTSPVGSFFRTNPSRRINTTILSSPRANTALIIDAIESTTRMLVSSLSDDPYGKAIHGVPLTVRTFTRAINAVEGFVQSVVKEEEEVEPDIEEVEVVLARLKAGLSELLSAFQLFLMDQGLSAQEHRAASNAARAGRLLPEREERKRENGVAEKRRIDRENTKQKQPKGDERDRAARVDPPEMAQVKPAPENRERDRDKSRGNGDGEKRPPQQKRLEPQDLARKKLFQDMVPKSVGRRGVDREREMEMVR